MPSTSRSRRSRVVACTAFAAAAAGGVALAAGEPAQSTQTAQAGTITACQKARGAAKGRLRVVPSGARCRRGEKRLAWAVAGPAGPAGAPGEPGAAGAPGAPGPKGDTGTPDPSGFYSKAESDARYLAATGKAADAELLDGLDAGQFVAGAGSVHGTSGFVNPGILDAGGVRMLVTCGTGLSSIQFSNLSGAPARYFDQVTNVSGQLASPGSVTLSQVADGGAGTARVQVAWGPALARVTTFTVSVVRAGGCPVEWWASAVTVG